MEYFLLLFLLFHTILHFPFIDSTTIPTVTRSSQCPIIYNQDPPANSSSTTAQTTSANPQVINGDFASAKVSPSLVALYKKELFLGWQFTCTGTLISNRWVITAAHCQVGADTREDLAAVLMRNSDINHPSNDGALGIPVKRAFNHEQYRDDDTASSQQHDIAAIELAEDAPPEAKPMKLNVNMSIPEPNSFTRVIGFGNNIEGDTSGNPRPLAQVDVPVTPTDRCARIHQNVANVDIQDDIHVCVGYLGKGGCGSCQGDSGGPLIQYNEEGEPVLVAVVSAAVRCAHHEFPTVNMRIANFRDWLDSKDVEYTASESTVPIFQDVSGLSVAAISGIAIGALLLAIVAIILAVYFVRRRRAKAGTEITPTITPAVPSLAMARPTQILPPVHTYGGVAPPPPVYPQGPQGGIPFPPPTQDWMGNYAQVSTQQSSLQPGADAFQPMWGTTVMPGQTAGIIPTNGQFSSANSATATQGASLYPPPPPPTQGGQQGDMESYSLPRSAGEQSHGPTSSPETTPTDVVPGPPTLPEPPAVVTPNLSPDDSEGRKPPQ